MEKLTLAPGGLGPDDVRPVLALGVSSEALVDAFHVAFLFNVYPRLADTLGWEVPPPEYFRRTARKMLERGYG